MPELTITAEELEALRHRAEHNAESLRTTRVDSKLLVDLIENYQPPR